MDLAWAGESGRGPGSCSGSGRSRSRKEKERVVVVVVVVVAVVVVVVVVVAVVVVAQRRSHLLQLLLYACTQCVHVTLWLVHSSFPKRSVMLDSSPSLLGTSDRPDVAAATTRSRSVHEAVDGDL